MTRNIIKYMHYPILNSQIASLAASNQMILIHYHAYDKNAINKPLLI